MTLNTHSVQGKWINWGAIATVIIALLYLFFWPGPEGLPFVKLGLSQQTIDLEASISGINDSNVSSTFKPGTAVEVSLSNSPRLSMKLKSVEQLPSTVVATQKKGTVTSQPDPRPEMKSGNNLLITLEGKGYANDRGVFLGLKRARVASTIKIYSQQFESPASIVNVSVN
jgi:hypothetical protein